MTNAKARVKQTLSLDLPDCYAHFLNHHGAHLAADPLTESSWIQGLGNLDFVIGTTQSFRTAFPEFPPQALVIGYAGTKRIEKLQEEIDRYTVLDTNDVRIGEIDSLGRLVFTHIHFYDWLAERLLESLLQLEHPCELFVLGFERQQGASRFRDALQQLEGERLLALDELVLVQRDSGGHLRIRHRYHRPPAGAAAGGLTGLLLGILSLVPRKGAVVDGAPGVEHLGPAQALRHAGLDDDFIEELSCRLRPGTWALLALVRQVRRVPVLEHLRGLGGTILTATVSPADKAALQAVLSQGVAP